MAAYLVIAETLCISLTALRDVFFVDNLSRLITLYTLFYYLLSVYVGLKFTTMLISAHTLG